MTIEDIGQILMPPTLSRVAWCGFDHEWYVLAYPEVLNEVEDPSFTPLQLHYIETGRVRGYAPNMYFDELWYQRRYRDVADEIATGQVGSGYEHYCAIGYLSKSPHWLYDDDIYAAGSPDLTEAALLRAECFNRYDHYLKVGAREGRHAHLLFDPQAYLAAASGERADVAELGAFRHFLVYIWNERRDVAASVYFDPAWYLGRYESARNAVDSGQSACGLHHYLAGENDSFARDPCPEFSERFYLDRYPDVAAAVREGVFQSGYQHFLKSGVFDLRSPSADIDLRAYLDDNAAVRHAISQNQVRDAFAHLLRAQSDAARPAPGMASPPQPAQHRGEGRIDLFGHHGPAHGWFFCGWLSPEHVALHGGDENGNLAPVMEGTAYFEFGRISGEVVIASFFRADLGGNGVGILAYLEGAAQALGRLVSLDLRLRDAASGDMVWISYPSENAPLLHDAALVAALRAILGQLTTSPSKSTLVGLATRQGYTGANTLADLRERVLMEFDEVIFCPPHGLLLIGWMLAHPGVVTALRVHSGRERHVLTPAQFAAVERPDVLASVGTQYGFQNLNSGFITYVPSSYRPGETSYIAVETRNGEIAYRGLPEPRLRGMDAMRFVLDRVEARHDDLVRIADTILGPALTHLNRARLAESRGHQVISFGTIDAAPEISVIVPLHGRLDFMEYQFAFAARPEARRAAAAIAHEYIYVLDDPRQRRQAEQLAASIFARFAIPFRLVLLERNQGFAPANNIALGMANGRYVGFVNSDVFAGSPDWLARLVARLKGDPTLGAVGPMLLFEDGSVQHIGMVFEPLPAFGNWMFPMHERKGWRPPVPGSDAWGVEGLRRCQAITAACMVMSRDLAVELGGFDEDFIIGDFEDADLCMKLAEKGLGCAVDLEVQMYHLERQSQAMPGQRWRMNLTLHNAWVHETRWGARLHGLAAAQAAMPPDAARDAADCKVGASEVGASGPKSPARAKRGKPARTKSPA